MAAPGAGAGAGAASSAGHYPPWAAVLGRNLQQRRIDQGRLALPQIMISRRTSLSRRPRNAAGNNLRNGSLVYPVLWATLESQDQQQQEGKCLRAEIQVSSFSRRNQQSYSGSGSELGKGPGPYPDRGPEPSTRPGIGKGTCAFPAAGIGPGIAVPAVLGTERCPNENATEKAEIDKEAGTRAVQSRRRSAGGYPGRRAALLSAGVALWMGGGGRCKLCEEAVAAAPSQEWNYGGPCGSEMWGGLCTGGVRQSPIDITSSTVDTKNGSLGVLDFAYVPSTPSILNTGHGTMQVSFPNAANVLKVKGQALQLLQFHFHAPSEHAFNGEHFAMEAHLVHRDPVTTKFAVVGVMLDASKSAKPNRCLAESLAYAPPQHGQSVVAPIQLSPNLLLPPSRGKNGSRGYVHYSGSLTSPPCSEGVEWIVLDTPLQISSSQVVEFMSFSGDGHSMAFNARPLQPSRDRAVFVGP